MAVLAIDRRTKPRPWNVSPGLVSPEWVWFTQAAVQAWVLWERGGNARDLVLQRTGTLSSGVTWEGEGLQFDGASRVSIPRDAEMEVAHPAFFAVISGLPATLADDNAIYFKERDGPWHHFSVLQTGTLRLGLTNGGVNAIDGTSDLRGGERHTVAGYWDGTTASVYVDGVLENSEAQSGDEAYTGESPRLGSRSSELQDDDFFEGRIDCFYQLDADKFSPNRLLQLHDDPFGPFRSTLHEPALFVQQAAAGALSVHLAGSGGLAGVGGLAGKGGGLSG